MLWFEGKNQAKNGRFLPVFYALFIDAQAERDKLERYPQSAGGFAKEVMDENEIGIRNRRGKRR